MNGPTREELEQKYFERPYRPSRPLQDAIDLAIWAMEQVEKPETKAVGFDEWWVKRFGQDSSEWGREVWNAAQAALIQSGAVIPVPPVKEWPVWAKGIQVDFVDGAHDERSHYTLIPRPVEAWRPCEGDKVWRKSSLRDCNVLVLYDPEIDAPAVDGEFVAAYDSADEITWTSEQLCQRGRFWESGK